MAGDADFWRMRRLLADTVPIAPFGFNWDVRWLDGQRFYEADDAKTRLEDLPIQLWETAAGDLAAYALPEGLSDFAHLQVHPDYRYLESQMIAWAEEHLSRVDEESGQRQLQISVFEYDALRQQILTERGYEKMAYGGMLRHMRLGRGPRPEAALAPGYSMRTTAPQDLGDCQKIADLLNAAFNRDFHNPWEYQNFTRHAPCFRGDLDLVAVAPDGSFAAYVGVPYDEDNRMGIFEPVCTHPDHQRKGLGRALMTEGLRRLWDIGAARALVGTGDMVAANGLYTAMGFTEAYRNYVWRKRL
jgi:GNAT superfamily N-acetyltransferase